MSLVKNIITSGLRPWSAQIMSVRYRYHADKIKKGPLVRRMGYNDPINYEGTLAHTGPGDRVEEMKIYRPIDPWIPKKALFGQNDYIDILGSTEIHPTRIMYNVPRWLRGIKGNEYQMLLRQRKTHRYGALPIKRPTKWNQIQDRIKYLYTFLNKKTKTGFSKQ